MHSIKKEVMKVEKDNVMLAPVSGEPAEALSPAQQQHKPHLMHTNPTKPGIFTNEEDRGSGDVDSD